MVAALLVSLQNGIPECADDGEDSYCTEHTDAPSRTKQAQGLMGHTASSPTFASVFSAHIHSTRYSHPSHHITSHHIHNCKAHHERVPRSSLLFPSCPFSDSAVHRLQHCPGGLHLLHLSLPSRHEAHRSIVYTNTACISCTCIGTRYTGTL